MTTSILVEILEDDKPVARAEFGSYHAAIGWLRYCESVPSLRPYPYRLLPDGSPNPDYRGDFPEA